jgi:anthraniloyl-CoA monooxygenase
MQFAFRLLTRTGRISYNDLRVRDSRLADRVDRWFWRRMVHDGDGDASTRSPEIVPPPLIAPIRLGGVTLSNRAVTHVRVSDSASNGTIPWEHAAAFSAAAQSGAGLILTELVAVASEARITPGSSGLYCPDHQFAWTKIAKSIHANSSSRIGIQLAHAGRRGSTRGRAEGLDRPLASGNWPLVCASPLPYTPVSQVPKEMDSSDMAKVREDFVRSARMANEAGFDMMHLHFAHGYLLASFLSPLTNQRSDSYGGSLENRLRFPLEIFDAVRAVWPESKPVAVALSVADCARAGNRIEDGVVIAQALKNHGCDLIHVLAGHTTFESEPLYGTGFLTAFSDQIRNEALISTMVGGYLTTTDQVNTVVAAGRTDLCIIDFSG